MCLATSNIFEKKISEVTNDFVQSHLVGASAASYGNMMLTDLHHHSHHHHHQAASGFAAAAAAVAVQNGAANHLSEKTVRTRCSVLFIDNKRYFKTRHVRFWNSLKKPCTQTCPVFQWPD